MYPEHCYDSIVHQRSITVLWVHFVWFLNGCGYTCFYGINPSIGSLRHWSQVIILNNAHIISIIYVIRVHYICKMKVPWNSQTDLRWLSKKVDIHIILTMCVQWDTFIVQRYPVIHDDGWLLSTCVWPRLLLDPIDVARRVGVGRGALQGERLPYGGMVNGTLHEYGER